MNTAILQIEYGYKYRNRRLKMKDLICFNHLQADDIYEIFLPVRLDFITIPQN